MAKKKQSLSFWEAHLEKLLMAASLVVGILVVAVYWIQPAGVEMDGKILSASAATQRAADRARDIRERQKKPAANPPEAYVSRADSFISSNRQMQIVKDTERMPLFPPRQIGHEMMDDPDRVYQVPEILALKKFTVDFTRAMAYVPPENTPDAASTSASSEEMEMELVLKDIDFVTVEAAYPLAELRQRFQNSFAGEQLPPKQRLEQSRPVAAAVELQRSRLLPDGTWGEYEKVSRMPTDELAGSEISNETYSNISPAEMDVLIAVNQQPHRQAMILQPQPYDLEDGKEWYPPHEKEKRKLEEEKEKKEEKKTRQAAGPRGQRTKTVKKKTGGASANPMEMYLKMMGMGGGGPKPTTPKTDRKTAEQPFLPGMEPAETDWDADEIYVWAHDDRIQPGGIYRYRLRVGFFNPIAGRNWFPEEQQDLKKQVVLWSDWQYPQTMVNVPERVLFFPKSAVASAGNPVPSSVRVDVYRREDGTWRKQAYTVAPGHIIGKPEKIKSESGDSEEELTVDFTTHMTILDIVPEVKYWYKTGRTYRPISTVDIIYRDNEGVIKRQGVDSRSWSEEYKKKQSQLNDILKEQGIMES